MIKLHLGKLALSLLGPFLAAAVGSFFTFSAIPTWYQALQKPSLTPPNFVFGPAWTILYFLMGLAFYDVWVKRVGKSANWLGAVTFFLLQLLVNAFWTIIFFGMHDIGIGLVLLHILWFLIFLTIIAFWRISKIAAILLLPYLAWVTYAALLNGMILFLNR
ncbi:MAG: tryptophan-rich sensory protein [Candidatus Levybacteria bacterium]|nr:tryptophan-rich sensory protein [Candidatus Levybacteria bacterium]